MVKLWDMVCISGKRLTHDGMHELTRPIVYCFERGNGTGWSYSVLSSNGGCMSGDALDKQDALCKCGAFLLQQHEFDKLLNDLFWWLLL